VKQKTPACRAASEGLPCQIQSTIGDASDHCKQFIVRSLLC